ncbi:MAG: hypothetical protein B6D59_07450 [Campylobacteraceae bacterium 4484_4]|nr:MAG: hypothetical protein B6D59_07450 [Campylobacteraceae bacterium 4484_4]
MRGFRLLLLLLLVLFGLGGCEKKDMTGVEKMHWDRDMCERCKMAISERKFAVQIVDPKTGRHYKFDDIGCAVLWLDEEKIPWKEQAIIWITDAKTGNWIDAKKAKYTDDSITPMAFGFAAYTEETAPKNRRLLDFEYVKKKIFEIEKLNTQKVQQK